MKLTNSEMQVLNVLWLDSPLTVGQIIERVQQQSEWHANTIKTLLTRLTGKQAVSRHKDGRRFFYTADVSREEIVSIEADGFLKKFFNGQMAPLIAHFAERKELSEADIAEIETILKELKKS
ncbi:MAG: CopY family transcriptional repressor [SAR86 cluster bacterium]|uniref:CopY family transcriptional repressor n=1 Tax=SAR86 cluster bacterium TaxID=2030880 RepID=A0A2A5ANA4_9GAMM|nr:MAG: CopY family transcriptional repressor [SAR86 cluster bacterium]